MSELRSIRQSTNAWACYDCGKCTSSCPIARAGADYSPRRHVLSANLGSEGEAISDPSIFSCLTCMQCDVRCPAGVDYTRLVRDLRALSQTEGTVEPDCPHGGALQSVMRMMASGGPTQNRLEWLEDDLKTSPDTGAVFFFTGCAMYYDAFFPELEVTTVEGLKAGVRVLNALGYEPVVSVDERCCGHDLLWNGDRESFEKLARHNIELVQASGASLLVTSCAECLRTWKLDYEPFFNGARPQMVHLTELASEKLDRLQLTSCEEKKLTYQDPCRLGRHLGIYEPPRTLLNAVPDVELVEMPRHANRALCCAGGTWSSCDRFAKQIQVDRLKEARATGADAMVTACPKCQVHFKCAMKGHEGDNDLTIEMKDIAEVVASALVRTES